VLRQGPIYVCDRQTVAPRSHGQTRAAHILGLDRQQPLGYRNGIARRRAGEQMRRQTFSQNRHQWEACPKRQ
jgi:hypothetical protein